MKITKKLLFLLCITSIFASRAMNNDPGEPERYTIYRRDFKGLTSINSGNKVSNTPLFNQQVRKDKEFLFISYFGDNPQYLTKWELFIRDGRADELSFENKLNQKGIDLREIEDAAIKADEQQKEAEKITARTKAPFKYYLKSYGPSFAILYQAYSQKFYGINIIAKP